MVSWHALSDGKVHYTLKTISLSHLVVPSLLCKAESGVSCYLIAFTGVLSSVSFHFRPASSLLIKEFCKRISHHSLFSAVISVSSDFLKSLRVSQRHLMSITDNF